MEEEVLRLHLVNGLLAAGSVVDVEGFVLRSNAHISESRYGAPGKNAKDGAPDRYR